MWLWLSSSAVLFPALTHAHGYIEYPSARQVGPASVAACGPLVANDIRRDNSSHIEGLPELAARDPGYDATRCNLWLCRGLQYGDNAGNVHQWAPGQVVELRVRLTIPHDGKANVSVVETASNSIIGGFANVNGSKGAEGVADAGVDGGRRERAPGLPLLVWPSGYANETAYYTKSLPVNNTDFNVTLPDVSDRCGRPGACVLQWWWYGRQARQTYESCIDFTMTADAEGGD